MSNTTHVAPPLSQSEFTTLPGTCVPYDSIREPGCYISNWSGELLRVSGDGVSADSGPAINVVGTEPLFATKISHNPQITVTKARLLAANYDLPANF